MLIIKAELPRSCFNECQIQLLQSTPKSERQVESWVMIDSTMLTPINTLATAVLNASCMHRLHAYCPKSSLCKPDSPAIMLQSHESQMAKPPRAAGVHTVAAALTVRRYQDTCNSICDTVAHKVQDHAVCSRSSMAYLDPSYGMRALGKWCARIALGAAIIALEFACGMQKWHARWPYAAG